MATFTDKFDRGNEAPITNPPWAIINDADIQEGIELNNQAATNLPGAGNRVRAFNSDTLAETTIMSAVAGVTSNSEAADSHIDIGVGGLHDTLWTNQRGVAWVRLEYRDFGERRISLWYENPTTQVETQLEELTVAQNLVEVENISGSIVNGGELGQVQDLRIIVQPVDTGLRVRGYLNQSDDDRPTIEAFTTADWPINNPKQWWFGFGANGAAGTLAVTDYSGEDYTVTDRAQGPQRENFPTLADVKQKLRNVYQRGTNSSNLPEEVYVDAIQFAYDELIQMIGDNAWFLNKVEEVSITWGDSWTFAFPAYMKRIVKAERRLSGGRWMEWNAWFSHRNDNDQLVYQTTPSHAGDNAVANRITYTPHHFRFQTDTDPVQFPWRYIECLVYGAAYRLALTDRSPQLQASYQQRYQDLMAQFMRDQNRDSDQAIRVMRPRRHTTLHRSWWQMLPYSR